MSLHLWSSARDAIPLPDGHRFPMAKYALLRDRVPDTMGVQKYDVPSDDQGGFTVKYWTPVNTPVFDDRGEIAFYYRLSDHREGIAVARPVP